MRKGFGELENGGMQSTLDGADRQPEDLGGFAVLESLEVDEHDHLFAHVGECINGPTDSFVLFGELDVFGGSVFGHTEEIAEGTIIVIGVVSGCTVKACHPVASVATLAVDGQVCRDGIEPGADFSTGLELIAF